MPLVFHVSGLGACTVGEHRGWMTAEGLGTSPLTPEHDAKGAPGAPWCRVLFGGIALQRWSVKGSWQCWVKLCHGHMVACLEREEKLSVELLHVLCCPRPLKSNESTVL